MNQYTKPVQKIKAKGLRATTFAIAKLEERYLIGEKYRKVQYCYRNISKFIVLIRVPKIISDFWRHQ